MKVGIRITCLICGRQKRPRGRSVPTGMIMCEPAWILGEIHGCVGYFDQPLVGDLWPGETDEQFDYPCSDNGTETVTES